MKAMVLELLKNRIVDVGEVKIARSTLTGVKGKSRYLIYLPMSRNYLWRALHESDERVRLYIEVPEDAVAKLRDKAD